MPQQPGNLATTRLPEGTHRKRIEFHDNLTTLTTMQLSRFTALPLLCLSLILANALSALPSSWKADRIRNQQAEITPSKDKELQEAEASVLILEAQAAEADGEGKRARDLYNQVAKNYTNTSLAPVAHVALGDYYAEQNQFEKAYDSYSAVLKRHPGYEDFNVVVGKIYRLGERVLEGDRPYYWGLIPGFRDYEIGIQFMEGVVTYAPYSDYAPLALISIAQLAQKDDEPELAIDALDRLINRHPESLVTPDAYLSIANAYSDFVQGAPYDQEATQEAIKYYQDFLILYPEHESVPEARAGLERVQSIFVRSKLELGEFYWYYRNNPKAAVIFLNAAITADPTSADAEEARQLIERIDSGELPPKTPYDYVFGRYEALPQRVLKPKAAQDPLEAEAFETVETEEEVFEP